MRFVYLDESGVGDAKHEPFLVVAGVIVHADIQLKAIEAYLTSMKTDYVHPTIRKFTHFHAKELFHGGRIFTRETYSDNIRRSILQEICEIPGKFDLPVVLGFIHREKYRVSSHRVNWEAKHLLVGAQSVASICCLIQTEHYMRKSNDNEVASVIYENNNDARKSIKDSQRMLKDGEFTKNFGSDVLTDQARKLLPLSRIVESPLFAEKNESSILQVADAVAWAINRKLRNADECDRFFGPIFPQLIVRTPSLQGSFPTCPPASNLS